MLQRACVYYDTEVKYDEVIGDVFYINASFNKNYFQYYGMEFKEFIKYIPIMVENILMIVRGIKNGF